MRLGLCGGPVRGLALAALLIAGVLTAVPLAAPASTVVAFAPTDDAYSSPGKPDGSLPYLIVDRHPDRDGYLRFEVSGLSQPIVRATLRFYAHWSHRGIDVRFVTSSGWSEATLTKANAPTPAAVVTSSSGALSAGWGTLDVTDLVTGDGTYAFALTTESTALRIATKEGDPATAPQLVIETVAASTSETTTTSTTETTPTETTPTETTPTETTPTETTPTETTPTETTPTETTPTETTPSDTTAPSVPTSLAVTDVSTTSVSLVWDPSTDDVGVTSYGVYRDDEFVTSTASPGHTLTGLICGTSYSVAVDAVDAAGNRSQQSAPLTVATSACPDLEPPSAPTDLRLLNATASSLSVAWSASSDNVDVSGYGVFLDGVFAATTTSLSYAFEALACGTSYGVGVEAYDVAGNVSSRSSLTVATSGCPDVQAPSVPEALRVVSATVSSVSVAWNPSSDNVGVTGYGVYRDGVLVATTTSLAYTFESLACGTSYGVGVEAYDAAGNMSGLASLTVATSACPDLEVPSTPGDIRLISASASSVSVAWNPSTDNVGVTGYGVYRDGVFVAMTTSLSYTIESLECGTNYVIGVEAYDAAGNASTPASLTVATVQCPDLEAPSVPEALRVVAATASTVTVAWDPSVDNVGVIGYRVYRDGVFVASTSLLTYTFGSLDCGSGYAFAVDAYDLAGNASPRAELTASTAPCPESEAVIAVAGDIAGSGSGDSATAALLDALQPAAVLTAGDNAYPDGSTLDYTLYYEPTWGRFKSSTYPTPGNHEYLTPGAAGYFGYFGARAGAIGKGYYSYDIGGWHLIALNSEIAHGSTSEQVTWLKNDLAATNAQCVLAYWHKPRFTAGNYSDDARFQPFWDALYAAGAEVIINGHDHNYQRYAPLTPSGARDADRGIREFVVGTGGRSHYAIRPDSRREAADGSTYGVLKLTLRSDGYSWEFLAEAGRTFTDSGTGTCH